MLSKSDPIVAAFIAQSAALVEIVRQQQETLDRIVTARFDRPVSAHVSSEPNATMPPWMMRDGPVDRPMDLASALSVESDDEFLKAIQ